MRINTIKQTGLALALMASSSIASASIFTFDFTGRLVVADPSGGILVNNGLTYTPIAASLTFDTNTGIGSSGLSITMNDFFLGAPAVFHDISMGQGSAPNLLDGNVLVDWNGTTNMSLHVEWDATGLYNAIDFGLQVGDTISGTDLIRNGAVVADVNSATPYSDILQTLQPLPATADAIQGPAPLAATSGSQGLGADTPFPGIRGYLDIGSGHSITVTSVSAVPVPAAVWLFGSGLLALFGLTRRVIR